MATTNDPSTILRDSDFPELTNDLILRAARGEHVERTPVWIMRQAGRYLPEFREARKRNDFFTICRSPELACEVTLQPIDRYAGLLDASIIFSDILVVPQAMGMEVQMLEKQGPHFPNPSKLRRPSPPQQEPNIHETLQYVMDAITLTRKSLNGRYPDASKELLACLSTLKAGAQMLQVFDSNAGELAPSDFSHFVLPGLLEIATRVKSELKALNLSAPIVVFARNAHYALEPLSDSDYDVIQVDFTLSPHVVHNAVKHKKVVQGNADPSLLYASAEKIESTVKDMLDGFGTSNGYIANLGHGMYPDHDPEHLKAYLTAIKEYSTAKNASTTAGGKKRKTASAQGSPVKSPTKAKK
ncbi:Uroporphyrinogen decarboxylase [Rhizoclosmatium globosum]|uniref:uroporphyrinogen decarboxylase n=1 Tax=Rhizoclosmatium globosum TaxID=329046 RepID=A0A1Y2C201_9FUNG|nr:Uroporphyrinogen decarboxylase [Rhizoclosmatium globosum]|eukprot:ORY41073.1 Uroporphyrinogen decarboxylase [Rhizoclosmatium globosum]